MDPDDPPTNPSTGLRQARLVEVNDEMIAAERRYIAAASVTDLTDTTTELALARSTPNLTTTFRERTVTYTTRWDAIEISSST